MPNSTDFSILNALAVELGEQRVLEMSMAYVKYVDTKRSGITPLIPGWGGQRRPISPLVVRSLDVDSTPPGAPVKGLLERANLVSPRRLDFLEPISPKLDHLNKSIVHSPRSTSPRFDLLDG
jgi:hypothetical protein